MYKLPHHRRRLAGVTVAAALRLARVPLAVMALGCFGFAVASPPVVVVTNAWARPTVPGQTVGAAYLDLTSAHGATLALVQSDAAGTVQVHAMSNDGDVMRMREVDRLALPAGKTIRLAPSGMHLMLLQLKKPLRPGDSVALDLTVVDKAGGPHIVHAIAPVRTPPLQQGTP